MFGQGLYAYTQHENKLMNRWMIAHCPLRNVKDKTQVIQSKFNVLLDFIDYYPCIWLDTHSRGLTERRLCHVTSRVVLQQIHQMSAMVLFYFSFHMASTAIYTKRKITQ